VFLSFCRSAAPFPSLRFPVPAPDRFLACERGFFFLLLLPGATPLLIFLFLNPRGERWSGNPPPQKPVGSLFYLTSFPRSLGEERLQTPFFEGRGPGRGPFFLPVFFLSVLSGSPLEAGLFFPRGPGYLPSSSVLTSPGPEVFFPGVGGSPHLFEVRGPFFLFSPGVPPPLCSKGGTGGGFSPPPPTCFSSNGIRCGFSP